MRKHLNLRETELRTRVSAADRDRIHRRADELLKEADSLRKLSDELFSLRAIEIAAQFAVRFRGHPNQEWALDLLERAIAGETDPENDPHDWEPPL